MIGRMSRVSLRWRGLGIATRLLLIAVVPAVLMFVAVTVSLYATARRDVREDVADRGRFIATTLAESSHYGLVSGNTDGLRAVAQRLLLAEPSLAAIDVSDAGHKTVLSLTGGGKGRELQSVEVPVRIESSEGSTALDPALPDDAPPAAGMVDTPRSYRTVGYVKVTMSPEPMLRTKERALLVASGLVLAATVLSAFVGLQLAQRLRSPLASVMAALRDIRQGRFDVDLDSQAQGELGELQKSIVQMASSLNISRHELEREVATRTKELEDAVMHARQADAEKRRLIIHSNALVEEERRRIALEIHDDLSAALISVRLQASALAERAAEGGGAADLEPLAQKIAATTDTLYGTARGIVKRLRPESIDTVGLAGAIEELVRNVDVHPSCRFSFEADPRLPMLRGEQAMPTYRIAQEAISNIVKHAQATQAHVKLEPASDGTYLRMTITDNGRGFDPGVRATRGLGLLGMRERVAAAGGDIAITSLPGQGTTIVVTFPMTLH